MSDDKLELSQTPLWSKLSVWPGKHGRFFNQSHTQDSSSKVRQVDKFVSPSSNLLRYIDDIDFSFEDNGRRCKVKAFSSSRIWCVVFLAPIFQQLIHALSYYFRYALMDLGTNYCNLRWVIKNIITNFSVLFRNLIDGTGLSRSSGFVENTRNKVCTQYDQRNCERFWKTLHFVVHYME